MTESGLTAPQFSIEMKLVTVNETIYGGGGGAYSVLAGGSSSAWKIAMHELGHSFSGLADEYVYAGYNLSYNGSEPSEANLTTSSTGDKWSHWVDYTDPDHPEMGPIGAYEGAKGYFQNGLFRPSLNSKMRSLDRPFDAVSREKIILDIYEHVDPLDGALDAGGNGAYLAERAMQRYGEHRIEELALSDAWYGENLPRLKADFEEQMVAIPRDADVVSDLQMFTMVDGTPRMPAVRKSQKAISKLRGAKRHGDAGIAISIGHYASQADIIKYAYESVPGSRAREGLD